MRPIDCAHWVFDLDGTLTIAVHDFGAIRRELGLPEGKGILEALSELPEDAAAPLTLRLDAIELELSSRARAASGAALLLGTLSARGVRIGILTRNSRLNALLTLRAAGLDCFFSPEDVIGRLEAAPKPSPDGIRRLLTAWRAEPTTSVMVGDYLFDLQAGRGAGVRTVYVDPSGQLPFAAHADLSITALGELLAPGARFPE